MAYRQPNNADLLFQACTVGNVNLLLKGLEMAGTDVNARRNEGMTSLMMASQNGHLECVKVLLNNEDIDVNIQSATNRTALILACRYNRLKCVKHLLKSEDIDIKIQDEHEWSAAMYACYNDNAAILNLLLDHSAGDIAELLNRTKNREGNTVLHIACYKGSASCVERILKEIKGDHLDLYVINNKGRTGFMMLCLQDQSYCITNMIFEMNAVARNKLFNQKDRRGFSGLAIACYKGNTDSVSVLLEAIEEKPLGDKRKIMNSKTNNGWTPLMLACQGGHVGCVRLLLQWDTSTSGNDTGNSNDTSNTSINDDDNHSNNNNNNNNVVAINEKNNRGWTALRIARKVGNLEIIELLTKVEGENR